MAHEYGAATAKALLEFPFGGDKIPLYEIRSDGIHLLEESMATVLNHPGIDWKPADDMDWSGAPDPITAPLLPIPFTAAQLAAFMLDGLGGEIPRLLEAPLGNGVQAALEKRFGAPRMRVVREALQEAYACFAAAEQRVGKLVPKERRRADALSARYDKAEKQSEARERVHEVGISLAEHYSRGDRARESIAKLKNQVDEAYRDAEAEWQAWRIAMVKELLHAAPTPPSSESDATPDWKKRVLEEATACREERRAKGQAEQTLAAVARDMAKFCRNGEIKTKFGHTPSWKYILRHVLNGWKP